MGPDKSWVHCGEAAFYANEQWQQSVLTKLACGACLARPASQFDYRSYSPQGETVHSMRDGAIPPEFWQDYLNAVQNQRSFDWAEGNVWFRRVRGLSGQAGSARNVRLLLSRDTAPELWPVAPSGILELSADSALDNAPPRAGGRGPAKGWSNFAEELAVYLFEEGLPEGQGTQGQSSVIEAIFTRLEQQGSDYPSRSTVQKVVSAALARCRKTNDNPVVGTNSGSIRLTGTD